MWIDKSSNTYQWLRSKLVKLLSILVVGSNILKNILKVKKVIFSFNSQDQNLLFIEWSRSKKLHHTIHFSIGWDLGQPIVRLLLNPTLSICTSCFIIEKTINIIFKGE